MSSRTVTIRNAIATTIEAATSITVLDGLSATEARVQRLPVCIVLVFGGRSFSHIKELGGTTQEQDWRWDLYIVGGAGGAEPETSEDAVLTILDAIEDALTGFTPTSNCGPMEATGLGQAEEYGSRIGYRYEWRHQYWRG